jgi:hypothetical protein
MGRKISTYYHDNEKEYCEVHIDLKEELLYIRYYKNDEAKWNHLEEFPNKSLRYVEDAAENWALGIKKIDPHYEGTLF